MTSRDRVLAALNLQQPDRVPLDLGTTVSTIQEAAYEPLRQYMGWKEPGRCFGWTHIEPNEEIRQAFHIDTLSLRLQPPDNNLGREMDNGFIDEWGNVFTKPPGSFYYDVRPPFPLAGADVADIEAYPWPDPADPGRVRGLADKARHWRETTDKALIADAFHVAPLDMCWIYLRGPGFLADMVGNKKFAHALMDKLTDLHIALWDAYLDEVGPYVDVIVHLEDLGFQTGPVMSRELYREMVRPYDKRLFDFIRSKTEAKLLFHGCGSVYGLLPELIDLGIDALNPIQVSATDMDIVRLKREFGRDIAFWGGIDTQDLMPHGTPEQVEEAVKRAIGVLGKDGGYILTAVHNIQALTPPENIAALYRAALEHGNTDCRYYHHQVTL